MSSSFPEFLSQNCVIPLPKSTSQSTISHPHFPVLCNVIKHLMMDASVSSPHIPHQQSSIIIIATKSNLSQISRSLASFLNSHGTIPKMVSWDEFLDALCQEDTSILSKHHFVFYSDIYRVLGISSRDFFMWTAVCALLNSKFHSKHVVGMLELDAQRSEALMHGRSLQFERHEWLKLLEVLIDENSLPSVLLRDQPHVLWSSLDSEKDFMVVSPPAMVVAQDTLASSSAANGHSSVTIPTNTHSAAQSLQTNHHEHITADFIRSKITKNPIAFTFEILSKIDKNTPTANFPEEKNSQGQFICTITRRPRETDHQASVLTITAYDHTKKKVAKENACIEFLRQLVIQGELDEQLKVVPRNATTKPLPALGIPQSDTSTNPTDSPISEMASLASFAATISHPYSLLVQHCRELNIPIGDWTYASLQDGTGPIQFTALGTLVFPNGKRIEIKSAPQGSKKMARDDASLVGLNELHSMGLLDGTGNLTNQRRPDTQLHTRNFPAIFEEKKLDLSQSVLEPYLYSMKSKVPQLSDVFGLITLLDLSNITMNVGDCEFSFHFEEQQRVSQENMHKLVQWYQAVENFLKIRLHMENFDLLKFAPYIPVPLKNGQIDWEFVEQRVLVTEAEQIPENRVVVYTPPSAPDASVNNGPTAGESIWVSQEASYNLDATDPFPNPEYQSYVDYYATKKMQTIDPSKPMIAIVDIKSKAIGARSARSIHLPSQHLKSTNISRALAHIWVMSPRIQTTLISEFSFMELYSKLEPYGVETELLKQALTLPHCTPDVTQNLERLEFFGDGVLKLTTTLTLFFSDIRAAEGSLTAQKMNIISNKAIFERVHPKRLHNYIRVDEQAADHFLAQRTSVHLNYKSIADVVEAIVGAIFFSGSPENRIQRAWSFLFDWKILKCAPGEEFSRMVKNFKAAISKRPDPQSPEFNILEKRISDVFGYTFTRPSLLKEAQVDKQRLEVLGDALLDHLCEQHLYFTKPKDWGPLCLTLSKHMAVSNDSFAQVLIKTRLVDFSDYANRKAVDEFSARLGEDSVLVRGAPKQLGDFFEAIVGSMFADLLLKESLIDIDALIAGIKRIVLPVWSTWLEKHAQCDINYLGFLHEAMAALNRGITDSNHKYQLTKNGFQKGTKVLINGNNDHEVAQRALEYLHEERLFDHRMLTKTEEGEKTSIMIPSKKFKKRKRSQKNATTGSESGAEEGNLKRLKLDNGHSQENSFATGGIPATEPSPPAPTVSTTQDQPQPALSEFHRYLHNLLETNVLLGLEHNELIQSLRAKFGMTLKPDQMRSMLQPIAVEENGRWFAKIIANKW